MKTGTTTVWSFVVCLGLAGTAIAAEAPPSPMVLETWACTYKEGKSWDDKRKARDYLVAQVDKAGLKKVRSIHWTQKKGMAPVDTVWFDIHDNLTSFAEVSDAWDASGIGPGVNAQFDKVEDCTAGLSTLRPFHQRQVAEEEGDDTTLVANLACNFKHGVGPGHMPDLTGHMGEVMAGFGADGPGFAALRQPVTSGPDFPDVFIFSVFDDMTHWAKYVEKLFGTDAGQRMRNHMNMVLDCGISMWDAQEVVSVDNP